MDTPPVFSAHSTRDHGEQKKLLLVGTSPILRGCGSAIPSISCCSVLTGCFWRVLADRFFPSSFHLFEKGVHTQTRSRALMHMHRRTEKNPEIAENLSLSQCSFAFSLLSPPPPPSHPTVSACVCLRARARARMCVCVRERERERALVSMCVARILILA